LSVKHFVLKNYWQDPKQGIAMAEKGETVYIYNSHIQNTIQNTLYIYNSLIPNTIHNIVYTYTIHVYKVHYKTEGIYEIQYKNTMQT
jgi:hypothetical protein